MTRLSFLTSFKQILPLVLIALVSLIGLSSVTAQTYVEHADIVDFGKTVSKSFIHPNGHVYLIVNTEQAGITTTDGSVHAGGAIFFRNDILYTHYDENGNLIDKAYIGGSSNDFPGGIHVDENNNVIIISSTTSADFPVMGGGSGSLVNPAGEQLTMTIFNSAGQMTFSDYITIAHNLDTYPAEVTGDGNGNLFLVWGSKAALTQLDLAMIRFNSSGAILEDTVIPVDHVSINPIKFIAKNGFLHLVTKEPINNDRKYRKFDYQLNELFSFDPGQRADIDVDDNFVYIIGNTFLDPGITSTDGSSFIAPSSFYIMKRNVSDNSIVYLSYFKSLNNTTDCFITADGGDMYIGVNGATELIPLVTNGSSYLGHFELFYMKKDASGTTQYAGFYGGATKDKVLLNIATDLDYFWLAGETTDVGFPTTDGSFSQGDDDLFAVKIEKNTGKVLLANRFGMSTDDTPKNFGLVPGGFVYVGKTDVSGSINNILTTNPTGPIGYSYYAKIGTCPTNFTLGATVSPSLQNVCQNGLVDEIVADPTFIDGATFPTLYKDGIPITQRDIKANYQWQEATVIVGPWVDIPGAITQNYSPNPTVTDKYYRRIDSQDECCGGAILDTTDVASIIVNAFVAPVADAGGIFNSCPGLMETIGASPIATGGTPPYTVEWFEANSTMAFSSLDNPSVATGASANSILYTVIVTDNNACKHIDQSVLNVYEADAGADGSFCDGTSGVRIGGSPIPGLAGVVYAWAPAGGLSCTDCPQPIANPGVATTYTLTLTIPRSSGGTCSSMDDVVVTPVLAPTNGGGDFAGPDQVACLGTVVPIGLPSEVGFSYTWAPGNYLTDNHIAQTTVETGNLEMPSPNPILYYLTAEKSGCIFVDNMEVAIIEARADVDGCGPRTIGLPDRTPNIPDTYTWTNVGGTGTFQGVTYEDVVPVTATPSGSTTYELEVSYNGQTCIDTVIVPDCGCVVEIDVSAPFECPDFSLNGGDVTLTATANTIDFHDPDYFTYTWSPAAGLSSTTGRVVTLTDDVQRTYTVTMGDPSGSGFMCTETIDVNHPAWSLPVFTSSDTFTCIGTPIQIGAPTVVGYTYEWETTSDLSNLFISDPIATVSASTNFTVTVTDVGSGCITRDTTLVSVGNVATNAGPDHLVCDNGVITLGTPAVAGATYSWSPSGANWQNGTDENSAEPDVLVAISTTFDLTVTDTVSGCVSTDTVEVTVGTPIPPFAMADIPFCPSTSGPLSLGTGAPVAGITNYAWTPATYLDDATIVHPNTTSLPNTSIEFTLVVTNADGCEQISTQTIIPDITAPIVGSDKVLCVGETTLIGDAANPIGGGISYLWSPATDLSDATSPNPTFTATSAGTTTYTLTKTEAGCDISLSINIVVNEYTFPTIENETVCDGACVSIGTPFEAGVNYFWTPVTGIASPNAANTIVCPIASTTYTLIAQGVNGCIAEQDVLVSVNATSAPTVTIPDLEEQCLGTTGSTFNATVMPGGTYDYTWSPNDGTLSDIYSASPEVFLTGEGTETYSLTVVDSATGCSTIEEVDLEVIICSYCAINIASTQSVNCTDNGGGNFTTDVEVVIEWSYAPAGENILVTMDGGSTQTIPSGAVSPRTVIFTNIPSNGSGTVHSIAAQFATTTTCNTTASIGGCNQLLPCVASFGSNTGQICSTLAGTEIGGTVFEDWNYDGVMNELDTVGMQGIKVYIYDCNGAIKDSTYTDANGNYKFTGLGTGALPGQSIEEYRIEFILLEAISCWAEPTQVGVDNGTTVQFVEPGNCASLGMANPIDYCQSNPNMAFACYEPGSGVGSTGKAFLHVPYSASGLGGLSNNYDGTVDDLGTVWGLDYQRHSKYVYAATFLKRHSGMADNPSTVYILDYAVDPSGPAGQFDLQGISPANGGTSIDLGTVTRTNIVGPITAGAAGDNQMPADKAEPNRDLDAFLKAGKISYGDIALEENGNTLWLVNLNQKALISVDVSNADASNLPASLGTINQYLLSELNGLPTCTDGVLRPWAIKFYKGIGYIGLVCDASISKNPNHLFAYVLSFDPANIGAGLTSVVSFPLNYNREALYYEIDGVTLYGDIPSEWQPWIVTTPSSYDYGNEPIPVLSNIEFNGNGLEIALMDLSGEMAGEDNYVAVSGSVAFEGTIVAGDLVHFCKSGNTYIPEGMAGCPVNDDGQPEPGVVGKTDDGLENLGEFYYQDNFSLNSNPGYNYVLLHGEHSTGAIAILPGSGEIVNMVYDPIQDADMGNVNTQGFSKYSTINGAHLGGYEAVTNIVQTLGKGDGLGEPVLLCNSAPLEIGNYVWEDTNEDGIQDACEPGIAGVNVTLYDMAGDSLTTVQTDTIGKYYFNFDTPGLDTLLPDTMYFIVVGESGQFNSIDSILAIGARRYTITLDSIGQGGLPRQNDSDGTLADNVDSDFNGQPYVKITTGNSGSVDHTFDFGFKPILCKEINELITDRIICSGDNVDTLAVITTYANPDSIAFVYFTSAQTDSSVIYTDGTGLDTVQIASENDTVRILNVSGFTNTGSVPDTFYVYGIAHPAPLYNICRLYEEILVIVNPIDTTDTNQAICQGMSHSFNGQALTTAGIYLDTLSQSNGCDSIIRLTLTVNPTPNITGRDTSTCTGQPVNLSTLVVGTPQNTLEYGSDLSFMGTALVSPITNTTYYVRDSNGVTFCVDTALIMVQVDSCDLGDLPDTSSMTNTGDYQTTFANNGPVHVIISGLKLGSLIDGELDGQPNSTALGDGMDEDGLAIFPSLDLSPGITFRLPLTVMNMTGDTAYIEAWVDWNGDGDFGDANEMVANYKDNKDGVFPSFMEITVPTNALTSSLLGLRVRLSNTNNMTPYGKIDSGEVEDYLLGIDCPSIICIPVDIEIKK